MPDIPIEAPASHSNTPGSHSNKWPVLAIGSLLTVTLTIVIASQIGWLQNDGVKVATSDLAQVDDATSADTRFSVETKMLSFYDLPNGSVEVFDIANNTTVAMIQSGEGAFLRGVLRSLTRERRLKGMGNDKPFELRAEATNRVWLIDKATGTTLLLNAFGHENVEAFARLLTRTAVADT